VRLVPGITPLTQPYWDGARRHQLLLQRCGACGYVWHPPLPRCPECHSANVDWIPASGRGRLYTYTVVYHATHAAMADKVPYISALVQLDEGPRVLTNLRSCSEDQAQIGMPLRLIFEELTADITLPQFEPTTPE
jgi:uncharacterized OB-fold protein